MRRRAFTLVEVMIAVAISMILMLGINQVFRATSDTVGAGVAISNISSADRNAQAVFFDDFRHSVPNPPVFIIANQNRTGISFNYNQYQSGVPGATYRCDRLNFFTSGAANRRTTADDPNIPNSTTPNNNWWGGYMSPTVSLEAYVCYGLLKTYNYLNNGTYYPGDTDSTNPAVATGGDPNGNTYARNWILGRNAFLLVDPYRIAYSYYQGSMGQNGSGAQSPAWYQTENTYEAMELTYTNYTAIEDWYVLPRFWSTGSVGTGNQIGAVAGSNPSYPVFGLCLAYGATFADFNQPYSTSTTSAPVNPATGTTYQFQNSRYDIVGETMDQLRQDVQYNLQAQAQGYITTSVFTPSSSPPSTPQWWNNLVFDPNGRLFLFECKPNFGKPLDPTAMALMSPYFVGHASNFIVEYAGDFTTENPATGAVTAAQPDGQIDYDITNGVKTIRWYGLTRTPNMAGSPVVHPLQYWLAQAGINQAASWEVQYYAAGVAPAGSFTTSANGPSTSVQYYTVTTTPSNSSPYVCVWQNSAPPLVRVTFKVEDGSGHLQDGRWYSYVLSRQQ